MIGRLVAFTVLCLAVFRASGVVLMPDATEIVIRKNASPTVAFAARELGQMLGESFGRRVPTVNRPTGGRVSVVLGENSWSRAAGLDVSSLARDAFYIRSETNRVFIIGRDHASRSPLSGKTERATLFGVYEFLHRFAGVRMYFPGELGTVVPQTKAISIPEGLLMIAPDYTVRRYGPNDGFVPAEAVKTSGLKDETTFKKVNELRLRMETQNIPCCHGQLRSRFYRRFHETHPEYFVMGKDGRRHPTEAKEKPLFNKEHVCNSSGIWNEIYLDARAYLSGAAPDVRKIPNAKGTGYVRGPGEGGRYYDVMPHDGFVDCRCDACQGCYDKSKANYATDLIWSNTVAVARRLRTDGIPGFVVQMAYYPYADVPDVDIPDNVLVMVAQQGPWASTGGGDPDALVKAWTTKLGHKVWLWTYPGKLYDRACPGIPQMSPHAWGNYFARLKDHIVGGFAESESDRWIYNYLNYYVFSRVCWNAEVDIDALLNEHHHLMFGAGAEPMKRFFESLEQKWVNGLVRNVSMGKLGPEVTMPSFDEIWLKIYSPETMSGYAALFAQAAGAVVPQSLEARRIAFMRRELLEPLMRRAAEVQTCFSPEKALKRRAALDGKMVWEDASESPLSDWKATTGGGTVSRGAAGPVSPSPLVFSSDRKSDVTFFRRLVTLRPGRCYRLSYFIKLADVLGGKGGGATCFVSVGGKRLEMTADRDGAIGGQPRLNGTTGWIFVENYFATPDENGKPMGCAEVKCRYAGAKGSVCIDGMRLEEIE